MEMLTDNPIRTTELDRFGFTQYATMLAEAIRDTHQLPFCIGIYGPWGTGKSSLMYMIQEKLAGQPKLDIGRVKSIWFNPWKYDRKEDLWSALIRSILVEIRDKAEEQQVKNAATSLLKKTGWTLFKKGVSQLTWGIVNEETLEAVKEAARKEEEEFDKYVNEFEQDFAEAVHLFTDGGKLVVFVDDLDRCLPENALTVLESLKLFIGDTRCVFVLGMDHAVVENGITQRYDIEKLKITGRDYLDKIVQVPFYIPPAPFHRLRDGLQVFKTAEYSAEVWRLMELGFGSNPRKCKRFVNCFYLLQRVMQEQLIPGGVGVAGQAEVAALPDDVQRFYLGKLLVMQMEFPHFYEYLVLNPDAWRGYEHDLITAPTLEHRDTLLKQKPSLEAFWKNAALRRFMESAVKGAPGNEGLTIPEAPKPEIAALLIKMVNLVSPPTERSSGSEAQSFMNAPPPNVKL